MKTKTFFGSAVLWSAIGISIVHAQTTETTSGLPTFSGGTNVAASDVPSNSTATKLKLGYLGIMYGPGLEFSGSHQSAFNGNSSLFLNNRPKIMLQTSENFEFGMEPRFNTIFGADRKHASDFTAENDKWRLLTRFKNVIKTDTLALGISPRLILPTSNAAHQQKEIPSPELVANLDFAPKNSRFSYTVGTVYQQNFFETSTTGVGYTQATTAVFQPWLEADYQLTAKTQLMVAYWPEWVAKARIGQRLTSDSQEIDMGAYFEVAKGWQVNPFLATDFQDMSSSNRLKNMQLNLVLIGSIL